MDALDYTTTWKAREIVKRARALGWSDAKIASELDVSVRTVQNFLAIEDGTLSAKTARKLRRLDRRLSK